MYLNEDEARARTTHPENLVNAVVEFRKRGGRPTGLIPMSPMAREVIAKAARVLPPSQVAKMFGIHPHTASNLKKGITSDPQKYQGRKRINEDLKAALDDEEEQRTRQISDKALDILVATLDAVDPSQVKDQYKKVKMAKELAVIHEKMTGKGPLEGVTKVIVYAPRQKDMSEFSVIDVTSEKVPE